MSIFDGGLIPAELFRQDAPHAAVYVNAKAAAALREGHPWIFASSIEKVSAGASTGDVAVVFSRDRKFLAAGLYDADSPVRVKVFAKKPGLPSVGPELFLYNARGAAELRRGKISADTNAWRLVHGDSDSFPGIVIDKYADALVCKVYSAAVLPWCMTMLREVARTVDAEIHSIVVRLSRELQKLPGKPKYGIDDGMIFSEQPGWDGTIVFQENGIRFFADLVRGQKTGFFLDQRDNRQRVGKLSAGKDMLNVFSYSGGFSLYAACNGAKSVTNVDLDPHAIEMCERNLKLNEKSRNVPHAGLVGNAFEVFADLRARHKLYDVIVVDPPSFAKSADEIPQAVKSYSRLAKAAVNVLAPNGTVVFASCSSRVDSDLFFQTVTNAAAAAGRPLHILEKTFHAPDHPAAIPEARYLKCLYAKA